MGKITEFKRVKCKKQLGEWYYKIEKAEKFGVARLDGDLYHLYNEKKEYENTFRLIWRHEILYRIRWSFSISKKY